MPANNIVTVLDYQPGLASSGFETARARAFEERILHGCTCIAPHDDTLYWHFTLQNHLGQIIASARLKPAPVASTMGGFQSQRIFRFNGFENRLPGNLIEIDRFCVAPEYRHPHTFRRFRCALQGFLSEYNIDHILCLVPIQHPLCSTFIERHIAVEHLRLQPRQQAPDSRESQQVPPLLRIMTRYGGVLCGPPAWDPALRCEQTAVLISTPQLTFH